MRCGARAGPEGGRACDAGRGAGRKAGGRGAAAAAQAARTPRARLKAVGGRGMVSGAHLGPAVRAIVLGGVGHGADEPRLKLNNLVLGQGFPLSAAVAPAVAQQHRPHVVRRALRAERRLFLGLAPEGCLAARRLGTRLAGQAVLPVRLPPRLARAALELALLRQDLLTHDGGHLWLG
eukprot:scaffold8856_cov60-Phaeocystis_antarctica.AAC.1